MASAVEITRLQGPTKRSYRWASEPFLHFTLLGALVFAGHHALSRRAAAPTIEVPFTKQRELTKLFEQRQQRPPTDAERKQLQDRYIEDEVLFREGQRLGLLDTDPMLRAQLVSRVRSLLQAEVTEVAPSEATLRSYYEQHRAVFAVPETISYREYWFPTGPEARDASRRLALALQRGEQPNDPALPSVINYSRRAESELTALQGPELSRKIWSLPDGAWRELSSSRGVHVVRIDERAPASEPPFESVRGQVLAEYKKEQTSRAFRQELDRLMSQWQVRIGEKP